MVVNGTMVIRTLHYLYIDVTGMMGASDDDVIAAHASDSSFFEFCKNLLVSTAPFESVIEPTTDGCGDRAAIISGPTLLPYTARATGRLSPARCWRVAEGE